MSKIFYYVIWGLFLRGVFEDLNDAERVLIDNAITFKGCAMSVRPVGLSNGSSLSYLDMQPALEGPDMDKQKSQVDREAVAKFFLELCQDEKLRNKWALKPGDVRKDGSRKCEPCGGITVQGLN